MVGSGGKMALRSGLVRLYLLGIGGSRSIKRQSSLDPEGSRLGLSEQIVNPEKLLRRLF